MQEFYSMFGLSVSDNKDRSSGTKECYSWKQNSALII